ncbi:MAG TPA: thiopeptide-type bacteriocin biosynthesis protein [Patescibacteria group bacterium]|nr:thiopeptide-type bacteriocin biosynthesis protein [Patescibacteria group bacterium]
MSIPQRCLYTLIYAEREHHEEILREVVTPVAGELRDNPELESLFFARYNEPQWQLRFRVLGSAAWVTGPVRDLLSRQLSALRERGIVRAIEFAVYQREYERYGGEEGMRLAEKIFLHDTLACLDMMEAERCDQASISRREYSLALSERFLDLMQLHGEQRLAFYAYGYRWALEMKTWERAELDVLEARFRDLKPGLEELFFGQTSADPVAFWGSRAVADIAVRCLDSSRPVLAAVLEGRAAGRIDQDLVRLAWSYTHMHCNRLGIDPTAEAILRYLMHRLMQERAPARA